MIATESFGEEALSPKQVTTQGLETKDSAKGEHVA